MSIKYNNEIVAGKYKSQIIPPADTVNSGTIRIATQEEVDAGESNTTAVTPQYLSTKQDKLVAGDNILLDENLIECTVYPDDTTIIQNEDGTLTNIAQKTVNGNIKIDWSGTTAEYERDMLNGTIQPDWYCYITDDEQLVSYDGLLLSDLSNLNDVEYIKDNGVETIQTINECNNMYTTDFVSYDAKAYNQLYNMKHSTFDLSKFTIVGSPNITSDGIVNNFSENDYIYGYGFNQQILTNFKITGSFSTTSETTDYSYILSTGQSFFRGVNLYISNYTKLHVMIASEDGKSWIFNDVIGYNIENNSNYKYIIELNNKTIKLYLSKDNSEYTEHIIAINIAGIYFDGHIYNGYRGAYASSYFKNGSIDLKQFSITVDGKEVFNGNKTGLDVIKEDNYTVVGSPTITEDGVASGFTNDNYIKLTNIFTPENNSWEINISFTTGNDITTRQFIINSYYGISIYITQSGNLNIALGSGSNFNILNDSSIDNIKTNTKYNLKISFNKTQYLIMLNNVIVKTISSTDIISNNVIYLGIHNSSQNPLISGSIDLNSFKIHVDNELVYQPCLKIPYTQSNTGSKIVDSNYRDRVYDIYEQYHSAPYYTIDTANKNITMPMGELYGMLENKADKTNVLNKSQITNCLLEVPQRIKYDLTDGILTVKAGSVVIVPYGNLDRTFYKVGDVTFDEATSLVSNFSGTGYIETHESFTLGNSWEIVTKFTTGDDITANQNVFNNGRGVALNVSNSKLALYLGSDGSTWNVLSNQAGATTLTVNTKYYVKVSYNGTSYTMSLSTDGEDWNVEHTLASTAVIASNTKFKFGQYSGTIYFRGLIDFSKTSIIIDGEQCFNPAERLTTKYPVGATFLNDNFKVADTQYEDGKFFVRAELQNDTSTTGFHDGQITILMHADSNAGIVTEALTSNVTSGTTNPATGIYYNTALNTVCRYTNSVADLQFAFPLAIGTRTSGTITSINQVFNSFGYIGSTVWVDKEVKGLIPNGRNEDRILKNIEFTTDKILTATYSATMNGYATIRFTGNEYTVNYDAMTYWSYNQEENLFKGKDGDSYFGCYIAKITTSNGVITQWNSKQPITVADIQDVVHKTGDTMSGSLYFDSVSGAKHIIMTTNESDIVNVRTHQTDYDFTTTTAPSKNKYLQRFLAYDKNNNYVSTIETIHSTSNNVFTNINTRRSVDGSVKTASISIGVDSSGNTYATAPTPANTDSSTKIATTAFVKNVLKTSGAGLATISKSGNGYIKFSNGIILQWGAVNPSSNYATVTFPTPFTATSPRVVATQYDGNGSVGNQNNVIITSLSATQFKVYTEKTIIWHAIAY